MRVRPGHVTGTNYGSIESTNKGWVRVPGHTKPSNADKQEVRVNVKFFVDDEAVFLPLIQEVVHKSRKEPGVIAYELFKNTDASAKDQYGLIQIWRSMEGEAKHMTSTHILNFLALEEVDEAGLDQSQGTNGFSKTIYVSMSH